MRVTAVSFLLFLGLSAACAQSDAEPPSGALVLNEVVGLHLSRNQIYDAALDAWTWTFGQEPGAHVDVQDRATGVIEGHARFNFRSQGITAREESMGPVTYQVVVRADNGQCTIRITRFVHVGNHNAQQGGLDLGPIYTGDRPNTRIPGYSLKFIQRLHAEVRDRLNERVGEVLRAFAGRLRRAGAAGEP